MTETSARETLEMNRREMVALVMRATTTLMTGAEDRETTQPFEGAARWRAAPIERCDCGVFPTNAASENPLGADG